MKGQMLGRRAFGRGVFGVLTGGVTAALSGCGVFGGNSYRFRMTVEVETPQGLKRGSSVIEVKVIDGMSWGDASGIRSRVKGEAVAVDIAPGQTLFALLKTTNPMREDLTDVSMAALDPKFRNDWVESAGRIARSWSTLKAELPHIDYPMLVRFRDLNDPKSVERVDPANLAASFGPGVTLRRITVEVTNEPVTVGTGKRLAIMGIEKGHGLSRVRGVTASPTLAQQLGYSDFVRGVEQ